MGDLPLLGRRSRLVADSKRGWHPWPRIPVGRRRSLGGARRDESGVDTSHGVGLHFWRFSRGSGPGADVALGEQKCADAAAALAACHVLHRAGGPGAAAHELCAQLADWAAPGDCSWLRPQPSAQAAPGGGAEWLRVPEPPRELVGAGAALFGAAAPTAQPARGHRLPLSAGAGPDQRLREFRARPGGAGGAARASGWAGRHSSAHTGGPSSGRRRPRTGGDGAFDDGASAVGRAFPKVQAVPATASSLSIAVQSFC
mmetsp:Transcript_50915/g.164816  ORF Transcript_50915/g.164816 Transcript_50915/m.164816 type:complete len:257 (-) Transcript_50915:1904-2674(-)